MVPGTVLNRVNEFKGEIYEVEAFSKGKEVHADRVTGCSGNNRDFGIDTDALSQQGKISGQIGSLPVDAQTKPYNAKYLCKK